MKTTVFLVGAGPGDPGLITVKGEKLLKIADVIVYDYLSNPIFLNKANNNCNQHGHTDLLRKCFVVCSLHNFILKKI